MSRKRVLLLLKPFDAFPKAESGLSRIITPKILSYLDNRSKVHKHAINFCQDILQKKNVDWQPFFQSNLSQPIHNVDLVITVGGDGTLLQASHFLDDSVPVLGVNSDPTQTEEVEEFGPEFDATRNIGYLCAATVRNFEQIVDSILEGKIAPSALPRMSISLNSKLLPIPALNDVLIVHPSPAAVSRFSFRVMKDGCPTPTRSLVNWRSSGLRVTTAAGRLRVSTAAGTTARLLTMSTGVFPLPILSKKLIYMVCEPILPWRMPEHVRVAKLKFPTCSLVKPYERMEISWFCREGLIFTDGSHVFHSIQPGDTIELSSSAPILKVFLPNHFLG